MCLRAIGYLSLLLSFSGIVWAQHAVDPAQRYHRLICLVHLMGSGTKEDPLRAEYVPTAAVASGAGIVAWSQQITDDGKMAIIHVVAIDRNAFASILADARQEVKVFEVGKDSQAAIESEMQKHKKGFTLDSMKLPVQ